MITDMSKLERQQSNQEMGNQQNADQLHLVQQKTTNMDLLIKNQK